MNVELPLHLLMGAKNNLYELMIVLYQAPCYKTLLVHQ